MCIRTYLKSHQIDFEPLLHAPATTASRRAHQIHTPGRQVAKSVLVKVGEAFLLVVLPATSRIDFARLSLILDGLDVSLATEDQTGEIFGDCQRGALPPFGSLYGLRTFVDTNLGDGCEIVCVGNQRHEGVRLRFRDYLTLESPTRASFATTVPDFDDPRRRQAG